MAKAGRQESHDAQLEALVPYLDHLPSEGRVLDYGCGPGRFREPLETRGLEYEGVDLIPWLGTMEVGGIEARSFDCAIAIFVLQHIVDPADYADAVDTVWGALKPGGKLLVVDHVARSDVDWADHMKPRGPDAIWKTRSWSAYDTVGEYDGHWIGLFTK